MAPVHSTIIPCEPEKQPKEQTEYLLGLIILELFLVFFYEHFSVKHCLNKHCLKTLGHSPEVLGNILKKSKLPKILASLLNVSQ